MAEAEDGPPLLDQLKEDGECRALVVVLNTSPVAFIRRAPAMAVQTPPAPDAAAAAWCRTFLCVG